jgi:hypothetical protein
MESIEILNKKLGELRLKWKDYPRSSFDPRWWSFNCDKILATRYKNEIEVMKGENLSEVAQMIFR